jgi:hypothetical protein
MDDLCTYTPGCNRVPYDDFNCCLAIKLYRSLVTGQRSDSQ